MKTADCPYCGHDCFTEAVRADAVNPKAPERYAKVYGHWFNKCLGCLGWSIYRDGKQFSIPNKSKRPKPYTEMAIE